VSQASEPERQAETSRVNARLDDWATQARYLALGATGWVIRGTAWLILGGSLLLLLFWFVLALSKGFVDFSPHPNKELSDKLDELMTRSGLVLFVLPIVAVPGFWVASQLANHLFSRRHALAAEVDRRPAILLLRSFSESTSHTSDALPPAGWGAAGVQNGVLLGQRQKFEVYVLPELAPLLAGMGQLIVIGDKPAETATSAWGQPSVVEVKSTLQDWVSDFRNPHVAVCEVNDSEWETAFRDLALASAMIVSLPGTSPSALKELRALIEWKLTGKLCFVMPPSTWGNFSGLWSSFRQAMSGTSVPEYRATGMLYLVNPDLSPRLSLQLASTYDLDASKLLEHVDRHGAVPLREISKRYPLS
jgi:hypothetical protein